MNSEIILYPTETLYALGVNALDRDALNILFDLKGRDRIKVSSWLVQDVSDIEQYAIFGEKGVKIAERFLPGALTLILETKDNVPREIVAPDGTIGFRVSTDLVAQDVVKKFFEEYDAPLTCTSANVSGAPVFQTVGEILQQFGPKADRIAKIVDDGPRKGLASTVVRVIGDEVTVLREGEISERDIMEALG